MKFEALLADVSGRPHEVFQAFHEAVCYLAGQGLQAFPEDVPEPVRDRFVAWVVDRFPRQTPEGLADRGWWGPDPQRAR